MAPATTYDVFLCHASRDKSSVKKIARRLEAEGLKPFLDEWHLVPGDPWQDSLARGVNESRSCAVFIGAGEFTPWQSHELRVALDRRARENGYRVIPVLLPGASDRSRDDLASFLSQFERVDLRKGLEDDEALRRLASAIRGQAAGAGPVGEPAPSPWRHATILFIAALTTVGLFAAIRFAVLEPERVGGAPPTSQPSEDRRSTSTPTTPLPPPPSEPPGRRQLTLSEGTPAHFNRSGAELSVAFSEDKLGTLATLRVSSPVQPPIVEALLGPGGRISFRSRSGDHMLTVVAWDPKNRTLSLSVDPPLE